MEIENNIELNLKREIMESSLKMQLDKDSKDDVHFLPLQNAHITISQKILATHDGENNFIIQQQQIDFPCEKNHQNEKEKKSKKRDDIKRITHNEVERRRRDKINNWILTLRDSFPSDDDQKDDKLSRNIIRKPTTNRSDSKCGIIQRACEYIKEMQKEINSLKKCLMKNEILLKENEFLRNENRLLANQIKNNST